MGKRKKVRSDDAEELERGMASYRRAAMTFEREVLSRALRPLGRLDLFDDLGRPLTASSVNEHPLLKWQSKQAPAGDQPAGATQPARPVSNGTYAAESYEQDQRPTARDPGSRERSGHCSLDSDRPGRKRRRAVRGR